MADAASRELALRWLAYAEADLAAARTLIAHGTPSFGAAEVSSYHCQQAAEKALKGMLVLHSMPVTKTHDLPLLLHRVGPPEKAHAEFLEAAIRLNPFGTAYRYPHSMPPLSPADAAGAVEDAELFVKYLQVELRP